MVRFGQQLRSSLNREWSYYYISYDALKANLSTKGWTEADEQRFVNLLEEELEKVFDFQKVKSQEIVRRINTCEKEVSEAIAHADEDGSTDDFALLEEDLSDIIAQVHDLARFTQLNYTGFQKIIKKHDKQTQWHLKPVFAARLNARPFFKDDYDLTVINLSNLYDRVRNRGKPTTGDSSSGGKQQNFIRQTTKYWVHPDNVTELKLTILKHLPVLVFNPSKAFEKEDSAISSVYFDNLDSFELYEGRLKKSEGAEAIRLRWYGGMGSQEIFVERKTHREDWTGEKSVKARFSIKEKNVSAYLNGSLSPEALFEKMRRDGKKSPAEIDQLEQLAREIQFHVLDRKLEPACRSFYNRTAFQLPGDARVRISLDTELTLINEAHRTGSSWRRPDVGVDYPFSYLNPSEIERFPYGILEVKLQTAAGSEPPQWIRDLVASHLVEAVPKFSKFIHGCATLFPRINLLPFWYIQMDTDIRKPIKNLLGVGRSIESLTGGSGSISDEESHPVSPTREDTEPAGNVLDEEERTALLDGIREADYPLYDSEEDETDAAVAEGGWKNLCPRFKRALSVMVGGNLVREAGLKRFKAPPGKKIHVPVRVEPKVSFAVERTFLAWFEFAILLGGIATTLLNFASSIARASAVVFTILVCVALVYTAVIFMQRVDLLQKRRAGRYHDPIGPTVLCIGVFIAVAGGFVGKLVTT
ncbi:SPX-domain-containing protein [Piedraia hortae CBS 480.64]|uniref:Vacuolar transporter chaperone complex subunit 4 n=1 Tax=Piedraia hortae CBS 480.64 TaxID=1314780 RepID=A0A6A7BZR7_9PEZI|nr:SPX-domain-containing protein [Piedraia hortae CBS 480.64]